MKVLVLILSSQSFPYTDFETQWQRYMNLDPRFECYFYKCNSQLKTPYELSGNTLWIRHHEQLNQLSEKLYRALEYFKDRFHEFDFVSRPNASSLMLWDRYANYLEAAPRTGFAEGHTMHQYGVTYPSGCGFTLSTDVAEKVLRRRLPNFQMDDVTVGKALQEEGVVIRHRLFFTGSLEAAASNPVVFHLRFRTAIRSLDVDAYGEAVSKLYGLDPYVRKPAFTVPVEGRDVAFYRWPLPAVVSEYYVDASQCYFAKKTVYKPEYHIFQREMKMLDMLKDKAWVPKVLYSNGKDLFVSRFVGERLTKENAPADVVEQAFAIMRELGELGITHNDIKEGELLVGPEGRLYLVDYGWSRLGGQLGLGCGLYNDRKPGGDVPDWNCILILERVLGRRLDVPAELEGLRNAALGAAVAPAGTPAPPAAPAVYKDRKRPQGSQSEIPQVRETATELVVTGYQHYRILKSPTPKLEIQSKRDKYLRIQTFLSSLQKEHGFTTLADLGCSAGVLSLLAAGAGFQRVLALDHDPEYLEVVGRSTAALGLEGVIVPKRFSFGDAVEQTEVVVMVSLLHWVFSCTALFGSFAAIRHYLKTVGTKVLAIEWIDPHDQAIQCLGHIHMNRVCQREVYSKENFLAAFGQPAQVIPMELGTRSLYVFLL